MKFYSEVTDKIYNTEDELKKAEFLVTEKKRKEANLKIGRETAAKKVEDAFKAAAAAEKAARKELQQFTDKYGSFHKTYHGDEARAFMEDPFIALFDNIFW